MTKAAWELQKAVYTLLKDDSELQTLLGAGKVFQHVPQGTEYPFVVVEMGDASNFDATLMRAWKIQFRVTSAVRVQGSKSSLDIQERIRALLQDASLTLGSSMSLVYLRQSTSNVVLRNDGKTYHGFSTFNALVQDTTVG